VSGSENTAINYPGQYNRIALAFAQICSEAAVVVMEVYNSDFEVRTKDDKSPVSDADEGAELIILARLNEIFPDIPVLAEESFSTGRNLDIKERFILVDPVDGTKEFVNKNGEFTVNIALIEGDGPVAGCVYAPAIERIYLGGETAFAGPCVPGQNVTFEELNAIQTRTPNKTAMTALMSRSHVDSQTLEFAKQNGVTERVSAGSSLKFCLLAEGRADVYPRFGPTMEWDTAAGHAVLKAAGGCVLTPTGDMFSYGKSEAGYLNGHFVAWAVSQ
jgi:3'(2'), 5'-bisphosphate nucleotidase